MKKKRITFQIWDDQRAELDLMELEHGDKSDMFIELFNAYLRFFRKNSQAKELVKKGLIKLVPCFNLEEV